MRRSFAFGAVGAAAVVVALATGSLAFGRHAGGWRAYRHAKAGGYFHLPPKDFVVFYGNEDPLKPRQVVFTLCLRPGGADSVSVVRGDLAGTAPGPTVVVGAGKCVTRDAVFAGGEGARVVNDAAASPADGRYRVLLLD